MNARTFGTFPPRHRNFEFLADVHAQLLLNEKLDQEEILMLIFTFRDFIEDSYVKNFTEEFVAIQLLRLMDPQYLWAVRSYWERSLLKGVSEAEMPVKNFVEHHNILDASLRYQELFFGESDCPDWWDEVRQISHNSNPRTLWDIGEFMELHREKLHVCWNNRMLPHHAALQLEELGLLELEDVPYEEDPGVPHYRWATLDTWLNDVQIQLYERFGILPEDFQDWMQEKEVYPEILQKVRTEHHIDHGIEIILNMITHGNVEITQI